MHALRDLARTQWERVRNAFSAFSAFLEERLAGLDDIRANGGGGHVMRRFAGLTDELAVSNIAATRRGQWIYLIASGLFSLGFAAALAVGAHLYHLRAVSIGTVFMFMQYAGMMAQPIVLIGLQLQQYQTASASLTRIRALLSVTPELVDGPGVGWMDERSVAPRVAFEDLSFAYRADAPVLRDVSLVLEAGTVLGLLGRTGSGKTTLSRLLFRLYDPVCGRITLDGEDLRDAKLAELRGRIGLVTQEVQLFDASVRDNATLFDPEISDERIVEVLTDLGLGHWLSRQPQGLQTVLVAGGGLSAGEAQLLAFARVFLKDPGLVVLDEGVLAAGPCLGPADRARAGQTAGRRRGRDAPHRHHHRPQALHGRPRRPHRHPRRRQGAGDRRARLAGSGPRFGFLQAARRRDRGGAGADPVRLARRCRRGSSPAASAAAAARLRPDPGGSP